jgi:fumarylacetoacetase
MVESQTALKSLIPYDENHHFPLENIPFGAFTNPNTGKTNCCTRIGDLVIDLALVEQHGLFDGQLLSNLEKKDIFAHQHLNTFMELGKDYWHEARMTL